jgi:hypothetical protein
LPRSDRATAHPESLDRVPRLVTDREHPAHAALPRERAHFRMQPVGVGAEFAHFAEHQPVLARQLRK